MVVLANEANEIVAVPQTVPLGVSVVLVVVARTVDDTKLLVEPRTVTTSPELQQTRCKNTQVVFHRHRPGMRIAGNPWNR